MIKYRSELSSLFQEKNSLGKGTEVGVSKGEHARTILSKYLGHLYLVDPWTMQDPQEYEDITNSEDHESNLYTCATNLSKYESRYTIVRKKSSLAANDFENESLDFVYIDANHKYSFVKADIEAWFPKVRTGGIVSGHDYFNEWDDITDIAPNGIDRYVFNVDGIKLATFGVNPAVNEFCAQNNYNLQTTRYEWFGSWYFIK
jgi:hypothetical protein